MPFWNLYILLPLLLVATFHTLGKYKYIPFFLFMILSMIRYDTVSDYYNYVKTFWAVREGTQPIRFEIGYILLNKLFSFSVWGFIPVLAISIFIPLKGIYNLLRKYDIVLIGFFLFVLFDSVNKFENLVRQGIAIGVFYFAINYVINRKLLKFSLLSLFAMTFHISAIVLFPFYFLIRFSRKLVLSPIVSLSALLLAYLLYVTGVFYEIMQPLFLIFDRYGLYINYQSSSSFFSHLIILMKVFLSWLPVLYFNKRNTTDDTNMIINLSWISMLGILVTHDFFVVERLFEYLSIFRLIALALMLKNLSRKTTFIYVIAIVAPLFIYHTIFTIRYYGFNNYKTVFSEDCRKHRFYVRTKDFSNVKAWQDREEKITINP